MLRLAPMAIELFAFAAIFKVVPHRTVLWRHALAGAFLAALLFELVKWWLGAVPGQLQQSYGRSTARSRSCRSSWCGSTWAGCRSCSVRRSRRRCRRSATSPSAMRLPRGLRVLRLLRMLGRFAEARAKGRGLHSDEIQRWNRCSPTRWCSRCSAQLCEIGLVSRAESGEWLLARDLDDLTMGELYEACQLRIPVAEAHLPCRDDALGTPGVAELDELRLPLRDLLKRRVSSIYADWSERMNHESFDRGCCLLVALVACNRPAPPAKRPLRRAATAHRAAAPRHRAQGACDARTTPSLRWPRSMASASTSPRIAAAGSW
jgi:membrane protein